MSAIEQPAERSGRITLTESGVSMSAVSAMKCTPQNTTHFTGRSLGAPEASRAAVWLNFSESPMWSAWAMISST